ncbi:hypothetical protein [Nocardioides convexus]|uniref:hypothetical protein n=1 Tax=Nocardioides convexus TaxID=2712224 RepID=UPI002418B3FB|nr:hypothetical protein [Nocardioides convexus]
MRSRSGSLIAIQFSEASPSQALGPAGRRLRALPADPGRQHLRGDDRQPQPVRSGRRRMSTTTTTHTGTTGTTHLPVRDDDAPPAVPRLAIGSPNADESLRPDRRLGRRGRRRLADHPALPAAGGRALVPHRLLRRRRGDDRAAHHDDEHLGRGEGPGRRNDRHRCRARRRCRAGLDDRVRAAARAPRAAAPELLLRRHGRRRPQGRLRPRRRRPRDHRLAHPASASRCSSRCRSASARPSS